MTSSDHQCKVLSRESTFLHPQRRERSGSPREWLSRCSRFDSHSRLREWERREVSDTRVGIPIKDRGGKVDWRIKDPVVVLHWYV